jgi:hypothetical protein
MDLSHIHSQCTLQLHAQEASACLASSGTKAAGAKHEAVETSETKVRTFSTSPRTERLMDLEKRMLDFTNGAHGVIERTERELEEGTPHKNYHPPWGSVLCGL